MESTGEEQKPAAKRQPKPLRAALKRKSIDSRTEDMTKRKRTFEDFFTFCSFVLAYEEQLATTNGHVDSNSAGESSPSTSSPSPSHTSTSTNTTSESFEDSAPSTGEEDVDMDDDMLPLGPLSPASQNASAERLEYTSDDESWNLVTCFCRRPFAGRPMIECSECQTWVHLFCAKIKKSHVPEVYVCPKCRAANARKAKKRKSKTKSVGKLPSPID